MKTTETTKTAYGLKYEPTRFRDRDSAIWFAARSSKPERVMLGDDGWYWLVCPADAARLDRAGIEYA